MSDINFEHLETPAGQEIHAINIEGGLGVLEYSLPEETGGSIALDYLETKESYNGVGSRLLGKFVERVGSNRTITGYIIHEGTVNWLARNGFYNGVSPDYSRVFTDPQILNRLPFRRLLDRVGAKLISLGTSYNERDFMNSDVDFPYSTHFVARTKSF